MILFLILLLVTPPAWGQDIRICGPQPHDADGTIHRSPSVLKTYQRLHPCPSTGKVAGKCPGWALDHVIPLACGGCDKVENIQWLKNSIKSCAGTECKDRWERKINCSPMAIVK